ncbi:MAG: J domain-containing protein [Anaerolineales bacterium]
MEYRDYYQILGVPRGADAAEIKRAYRKLAVKFHPDKNPGDAKAEEKFKQINEAYAVLRDPGKRAKYDQLGASYQEWERRGGPGSGFDWSQWFSQSQGGARVEVGDLGDLFGTGFSDFFQSIFGGMPGEHPESGRARGGRARGRGRDLEQPVPISLAEAYTGTRRTVTLDGRSLDVSIPAGARSGTRVRLGGKGQAGPDQAGDLYLLVQVLPDPLLEQEGDDLRTTVSVDITIAVLGGEVNVPTPGGPLVLTIPPGSQPGQVFRLKGRGMPLLRNPSEHGDLYVQLSVDIPTELSERERELFHELARLRRK